MDGDGRFDPDAFTYQALPAILARDAGAINAWLTVNVDNAQAFAQLLRTLAGCAAILFRTVAGRDPEGSDIDPEHEGWAMQSMDGSDGSATDPGTQAVRFLVATLNDDQPAIAGMLAAMAERGFQEYGGRVAVRLIGIIADLGDAAAARGTEGQ